jgi:hypothetical protein
MRFKLPYFIVLGRIFDNGSEAHSIHKFLAATVAHPQFFSKVALADRKARESNGNKPDYLDDYLKRVWEPTAQELRVLKKMLRPSTQKFAKKYEDIRNQVYAHKQDKIDVSELFSRTSIGEIEDILYSLRDIMEIIWQLYHNGRRPEERTGKYDHKDEIQKSTRNFLRTVFPNST